MSELISCLCTQKQLESESFVKWIKLLTPDKVDENGKLLQLHRKLWELAYVTQALDERGMLAPGRKGLAFAVGQEPLPAYFASRGCEILATDLGSDEASDKGWIETNQHAASVESLQRPTPRNHSRKLSKHWRRPRPPTKPEPRKPAKKRLPTSSPVRPSNAKPRANGNDMRWMPTSP